MEKKIEAMTFLEKLQKEINYIKISLLARMDQIQKEKFTRYEQFYSTIEGQLKKKEITEDEAVQLYGQFLKTLKKFKRNTENLLKFNERDIDAFRKRQELNGQQLLSIFHDIKMNVSERMNKFDINKIKDPNLQHHLYTCKELCEYGFQIFEIQGYYKELKIEPKMLQNLIKEICLIYNINPYHNFTHAFSLFQMLFCLSQPQEVRDFLQPFDIFCGLIACLAHDMNHKGLNNAYKMKKKAQKSIMYCETAILENMHSSLFFNLILKNPQVDITSKFSDQNQVNYFKRLVQSCILATDMGKHFKLLERLQKKVNASNKMKQKPKECNEFEQFLALKKDFADDRKFILNNLVHACDIGNPSYSFNNYMNWSVLCSQEFQDQTLKEERMGLPVTQLFKYKDKIAFYNGQCYFSKQLALPLWSAIADYFQSLKGYKDTIEQNIKKLEEEVKKLTGQSAKK